jgi:hypothetical protein
MSWLKIQPDQVRKASRITISLSLGKKSKPTFNVSFPSTLSGPFGFDADGIKHCDIHRGEDDHAGMMWVQPVKGEGFNVRRLTFTVTVRMTPPAGLALREQSASLDYETHPEGGFVVKLPDWAVPGQSGDVTTGADADARPAALEVDGTRLILGGREIVMSTSQAIIADLLVTNFGKVIDTKTIIAELNVLEPKTSATPDAVKGLVTSLAERLHAQDWPILIVQSAGVTGLSWRMRRAVT